MRQLSRWTDREDREILATVKVRSATADDIASVAEVHVRSWQETYIGQVPQDHLDGLSVTERTRTWQELTDGSQWPNHDVLVLEDDQGIVVGFATISPSRDPDAGADTGEIPAIYTRSRAWGRGWGRALMQAAVRRLKEEGFEQATLWVLDTNDRARRFYEAAGWTFDGATKPHVIGGQPVTELRYRTTLDL